MPSKPDSLHRWQERYHCQIHGRLSTRGCVACSAELALREKLAAERERLKAKQERMASTLTNDEGSG
jgi:hypothetical protein